MKFNMRLTEYDSGDVLDITGDNRDLLVYEKTNKGKTVRDLGSGSITELYKLAHIATARKKLFNGTLAEFQEKFDLDELPDDEDGDEDPTQPDHSTEG